MATWEIEIKYERRSAIYTPLVNRPALGLTRDVPVNCEVWGCYQVNDGDDINPYFVIELENGRCTHALIEQIQFIREDDECSE